MNDNFVLSKTMNGSKCVINISQICRIEEHDDGGTIVELSSGRWLTTNDMTLSDWRKIIKGDGEQDEL